jgi:hypothetical protein
MGDLYLCACENLHYFAHHHGLLADIAAGLFIVPALILVAVRG